MDLLRCIGQNIKDLLNAVWFFFSGFLVVCAIYYCLLGVDQGIDVLVIAGEKWPSAIAALIAVVFWALVVWYFLRIVSLVNSRDSTQTNKYIPHMPRFLAYNCFIAIQTAVVSLPSGLDFTGWKIIAFIAAHQLYYALISVYFKMLIKKQTAPKGYAIATWGIAAAYIGWQVYIICNYCFYKNISPSGHEKHLIWLHLHVIILFIIQCAALYLVILRRQREHKITRLPAFYKKYVRKILTLLKIHRTHIENEEGYFFVINVIVICITAICTAMVRNINYSAAAGPLAGALFSFSVLVGFLNIISALSIRLGVNLNVFLVAIAFTLGALAKCDKVPFLKDQYEVKIEPKATTTVSPTTEQFTKNWVELRKDSIINWAGTDTTKKYPIFIVVSSGGASRSAYWGASVLAAIADSTPNFNSHLLCIAGASGGSLGNGSYYALLRAQQANRLTGTFSSHIETYYQSDFLTYTLSRLLCVDFFRISTLSLFKTRADALEKVIEEGSKDELINNSFASTLDTLLDASGNLPALFVNVTNVRTGHPGFIGTIDFDEKNPRQDILNGILDSSQTIRLSAAVVLGARFPYISPAGNVKGNYYVDGGYFDNTGAGTVVDFLEGVVPYLDQNNLLDKVSFKVIQLRNGTLEEDSEKVFNPYINDLFTPFITLAAITNSSTSLGDYRLEKYIKNLNKNNNKVYVFNLYDEEKDKEKDYPMSWVLSKYQLHRMSESRKNKTNSPKFKEILESLR